MSRISWGWWIPVEGCCCLVELLPCRGLVSPGIGWRGLVPPCWSCCWASPDEWASPALWGVASAFIDDG
eukprot:3671037-Lingulodinium_polyedra.AAC.1